MKVKLVKSLLVLAMLSVGSNLMAAEPRISVPEQTWTVNFKDTDIVEVAKFVQEVTGKPLLLTLKYAVLYASLRLNLSTKKISMIYFWRSWMCMALPRLRAMVWCG